MSTTPLYYRKKPVVIEAMKYDGENVEPARHWADGIILNHHCWDADYGAYRIPGRVISRPSDGNWNPHTTYVVIDTLEGPHFAMPGDWIIKGVKGEFYPCKPDIFAATYEKVEP